jgi:hypothetical protein
MTTVRAVLDATAVAAYARGSVDLGEVITEIAAEEATVGLPVVCLIEASPPADEPAQKLLSILTALPHSVILPLNANDWQRHASAARLLGTLGRAQAALTVVNGQATYILTTEPDAYGEGIPTIAV